MTGLSSTSWLGRSLPLPLWPDPFGFPGCHLYTSIELAAPVTTGTAGVQAGYAFADVPIALSGGLGVTLHGQWLVVGAGRSAPGALSGGLSWQH